MNVDFVKEILSRYTVLDKYTVRSDNEYEFKAYYKQGGRGNGSTNNIQLSIQQQDEGRVWLHLMAEIETSSVSLADPKLVYQNTSARRVRRRKIKGGDVFRDSDTEKDVAKKVKSFFTRLRKAYDKDWLYKKI